MGPGGTLGLKHGVSRIDDLTTGEFASCSGVNLAGCIRVLWFVVWVWVWVGVGVGALGLVVRREWLPRDGDPGLRKRSKCQLPRDGRTAAAIPAWRACPLILTPARLSLHLPPWAERPMPDSKEGASHPTMPTAGALPPRQANRRRAGDPGAGDPWLRANSYSPPEGRGFYRWLLASLGPSARCGGLPGGLPLLPPPGNNDMSDRKPVLGDLRGGAGSFSRGKGRNCRSFFLGETE